VQYRYSIRPQASGSVGTGSPKMPMVESAGTGAGGGNGLGGTTIAGAARFSGCSNAGTDTVEGTFGGSCSTPAGRSGGSCETENVGRSAASRLPAQTTEPTTPRMLRE